MNGAGGWIRGWLRLSLPGDPSGPGIGEERRDRFAPSIVLPPPKEITMSQDSRRASATPDSTSCTLGSPSTSRVVAARPASRSFSSTCEVRSRDLPVTTSGLFPNSRAAGARSRTAPAPKTILVAVANSSAWDLTTPHLRECVGIFYTGARLRHSSAQPRPAISCSAPSLCAGRSPRGCGRLRRV